MQSETLIAESS